MVNYSNNKIVSIGIKDHTPVMNSLLSTTIRPSQFLAELKRKYNAFTSGRTALYTPVYDIIDKIGVNNLTVKPIISAPAKNKQEANKILEDTKIKYIPIVPLIPVNVKDNVKNIAEITKIRYEANLKIVMKLFNYPNIQVFYNDADGVISNIEKLDKSNETKKNYIKAVLSIIPAIKNDLKIKYGLYLHTLNEAVNNIKNQQIKPEGVEYKNSHTLNLITKKLKDDEDYKKASVSVFYTGYYMPVSRLKEIYTLKYKNPNIKTDNYINFKTGEIVFNDYKTSKLYGTQTIKMDNYISGLFLKLISSLPNIKNDYLFIRNSGLPYNEVDFSKLVNSIFGVGVNQLRSFYLTDNFNKGLLNTEKQKNDFARGMRNSKDAFKHYIKF